MARDFTINGPALVQVKGNVNTAIANLSQLGLSDGPIAVTPTFHHKDINVDAWGETPADVQWMLGDINLSFTMIHVDLAVLEACIQESMGGPAAFGQMAKAGTRMGNNVARFAATNHYIGLNITSPDAARPWRFFYAYLANNPFAWPLGTEKSIISCNWRVVAFTTDPYGAAGQGAQNYALFDRTLDA